MAADENILPAFNDPARRGAGRPKILDDPEKLDLFAKACADGLTNKDIAEAFAMGERTVREYKKDPRVRTAALKYVEERVVRITRKTDSEIERRLEEATVMDVETLLKIRKEFLGGIMRQQTQGDKTDDRTINDALDEIEKNPGLADELQRLLADKK